MREERRLSVRFGLAACALALPLLLAQCGDSGDVSAPPVGGASGFGGHGGANGGSGGSPVGDGGVAGTQEGTAGTREAGGSAGAREEGGAGGAAAGSPGAEAGAAGALSGSAGSGECDAQLTSYASPTAAHVSLCSAIEYAMNPPVYGNHYPIWAAYKSYSTAIPLGFLVHNLEHGAVVILYHCPSGCTDEVAAAQAFIDALPPDPRCSETVKHQVILSPDATLPTRWAAIAWGHSLAADCFTSPAFRTFYDQHVAHGSEDICADGEDLSAGACQ